MRHYLILLLMVCTMGAAGADEDQPVRTIADTVRRVTVSADRTAMAWYGDGDLQIWDFATVVPRARWVAQGTPVWLRLAPHEHGLLVGLQENRVEGWSLQGQKLWSVGVDNTKRPASFSADGTLAAFPTQGDAALTVVDTSTGQVLRTIQSHAHLEDWAFSPAQPMLALAWSDRTVELFSADGSHRIQELNCADVPLKLVWSPNGRRMLLSEGDVTLLLTTSDWREAMRFELPHWRIRPVAWAPGRGHFALTHFKAPTRYCNSLRELPSGRAMRLDDTSEKATVDFSPDDHLMALVTEKVRVYRLVDADLRYTAPDIQPREAWFAPGGHRMMVWTWGGQLKIWDF